MKKRFKSIFTTLLAVLILSTTVGCNSGTIIEEYDETKSLLTVYSYDGGVGNVWLDKAIERFEKDYENYSFEPGKVGVQVAATKKKEGQDLSTINQMEDIIFSEWCDIPSLFSTGKTLPITDIMNVPLNEYLVDENGVPLTNDTDTIEDKLYDSSKDFFTFKNNQYYGLPHYSHFSGIVYNKALFDKKDLYLAKTPTSNASAANLAGYFISATNSEKSCGPDGEYGTSDDGLPATYDEFFRFCDYMTKKTVKPFIWTGSGANGYTKYLLNAIYLNLAGKEVADMNYTFNSKGKEIEIVTFEGSTLVEGTDTVKPDDFDAIFKQKAKYQALEVYDKIIDTAKYQHDTCNNSVADNLRAQEDYVKSYNEGNPIAFLVEGSYWYSEATDSYFIDDARDIYQEEYDELNDYRMLPLPRVYSGSATDVAALKTEGKLHAPVVGDQSDSLAAINANIANKPNQIKLAKTFLAYLHTQESLAEFTKYSSTIKFMNYDVDTSTLLNDYAKNLWDYVEQCEVVLPYSSHTNYINGKENYTLHIQGHFWDYGDGSPMELLSGSSNKVSTFFKNYYGRR